MMEAEKEKIKQRKGVTEEKREESQSSKAIKGAQTVEIRATREQEMNKNTPLHLNKNIQQL